jgi:hypothetical protein
MLGDSKATFIEMAYAFPIRTGVFTLVPLLFAVSQTINTYLYGGSLLYTAGFAAAVLAYAISVNQYHLAAFQRTKLSPE